MPEPGSEEVFAPPAPAPTPPAPPTPPPAPAPIPAPPVVLVLVAPWRLAGFDSSVEGWGPISRSGTAGPAASADQVVAVAAQHGVTLERR